MKNLIYVSCDPKAATTNFVEYILFYLFYLFNIIFSFSNSSLCRPSSKRVKGDGFRAVRAIPVDMFPMTNHCELIIQFTRETQSKPSTTTSSQIESTSSESTMETSVDTTTDSNK